MIETPKNILVLCTVQPGLDAVTELLRRGIAVCGVVGLHPDIANPKAVSGWIDVAIFANRWHIPHFYVRSYELKLTEDRALIEALDFDLVWVAGWQRLVPTWLIDFSRFGVLGGHGSPDGIHGGRGRSPQNWALMLNCRRFDLSLFRITPGIDDGPILATRSFLYADGDDIAVSYYRSSLAMAEMLAEVLEDPSKLLGGVPQPDAGFYYPQRRPEDGWVDWSLPRATIAAHCRALTTPYPGLITKHNGVQITLWQCHPFDDAIESSPGVIGACFETGEFIVSCVDGRVLVRKWEATEEDWRPKPSFKLLSRSFSEQLRVIVDRHRRKYPELRISPRITGLVKP
jgi:methionyl-tRNA formyltransferase